MLEFVVNGKMQPSYAPEKKCINRAKEITNVISQKTNGKMDELGKKIRELATKDLQNHEWMGKEFSALRQQYKKENISPDRASLQRRCAGLIRNIGYTNGEYLPFHITGMKGYTGKIIGGIAGTCMSICNEHGEVVLSYSHPPNGGWIAHPTKAEMAYDQETKRMYVEAYKEAKKELLMEGKRETIPTLITLDVEEISGGFDIMA